MSIVEPTLLSLARAAAVSLATLAMLLATGPGVGSTPRAVRAFFLWMTLATLLMPGFAIGFTYFDNVMKHDAFEREQLHCLFTWLRYSPLAVLMVWLMSPSLSAEAMHCLRIGTSLRWWARRKRETRAWGRGLWLGVALVFLLAFQEFEIATTWNLRAWPVALFDAQAGGLALGESLRLAALPFVIQALLIATLAMFIRSQGGGAQFAAGADRSAIVLFVPMIGFMVLGLFPALVIVGMPSVLFYAGGMKILELAPWREIWNGIGIAAAATMFAWLFAGWLEDRRRTRWVLALPGLLGPMLCGLVLLALLQAPPLHLLSDTIFPAVLGLALVLLPLALLLRFGIETTRDDTALHVARASGARRAAWHLDGWPRVCAVLMLFCFGYGDFTINSLLAPPQFTSASVRLLNLLHYGRSDMLLIMFILAFAVPFIAALLTVFIARFHPRRRAS
jgi:ABC-type Fe3+ transport system permease subunit